MKFALSTSFLALATTVLALPHGDHYAQPSPSGTQAGTQTGTPSGLEPLPSSSIAVLLPDLNSTEIANITDSAHDETPGSGGIWTLIVDDEDPRSLQDLFDEMQLDASTLKHVYNNSAFKGFAGELSSHCVNKLQNRTGLKMFEPEFEVRVADNFQKDAPWGLQRLSQGNKIQSLTQETDYNIFNYTHAGEKEDLGRGVDIYILDTGLKADLEEFQGRAFIEHSFDGDTNDYQGHGTHCAGTAASLTYGVAKNANIIGVKVLNDAGTTSDILAGIEYVVSRHESRKNDGDFSGSVASMSLGSAESSAAINEAVMAANANGIHFSVAAGNENQDACNSSPAGAAGISNVISVGATTIDDQRADFSNFGKCTTVYAPGMHIKSTWNGDTPETQTNVIDGTSMACPHITGLIAYHLAQDSNLKFDVKAMKDKVMGESSNLETDKGGVLLANNGRKAEQEPLTTVPTEVAEVLGEQLTAEVELRGVQ